MRLIIIAFLIQMGTVQAAVLSLDGGGSTSLSQSDPAQEALSAIDQYYSNPEPGTRSLLEVDVKDLGQGEDKLKAVELSNLIRAGSYEKAIDLLGEFDAAAWNNPNFDLVKAQICLMQDDLPEARRYARRSIQVAKDFVRAYKFLAYIYMRQEDWRRAKITLLKGLEMAPEDMEIFVLASYAFKGDGEPEQAVRLLEKAVTVDPKSSIAFEKLGVALLDVGNVDRALKAFVESTRLDNKNARAFVGLGTACVAKGWPNDALTAYAAALARDPNNSEAMTNLGVMAFNGGQYTEALELVCKGYLAKPNSDIAWDNFIIALHQLFPLLPEHYAFVRFEGTSPYTENQRHYQWAIGLSQVPGGEEAALRHLLRAAFLHRQHAEIINDLGAMFATYAWSDVAKALFTKALVLHPGYQQAGENLRQLETLLVSAPADEKVQE